MALLLAFTLIGAISAQTPATSLRIVVLEGEDAVNIVQQKTAVRPLVEVRDRNNLPVPSASVTFTVGAGQPAAFAGGAQTLTVTTDASGQAAASSFNATSAGKVNIQVQAAHQGQIASATITQTNFLTAAAAAAAGAAVTTAAAAAGSTGGAATAGAAGAAGAGGGGLSATTIAIVGAAAVGGGAIVATQTGVIGGGGNDRDAFDPYEGAFSGPFVFTSVCTGGPVSPSTCSFARSMSGTMRIDLKTDASGGAVFVEASQTDQSVSGSRGCTLLTSPITFTVVDTTATGGPSGLKFTSTRGEATQRTTVTFTGSHSGNTVTGSLAVEITTQTTGISPTTGTFTCNGRGTTTVPITLQRTAGSR